MATSLRVTNYTTDETEIPTISGFIENTKGIAFFTLAWHKNIRRAILDINEINVKSFVFRKPGQLFEENVLTIENESVKAEIQALWDEIVTTDTKQIVDPENRMEAFIK